MKFLKERAESDALSNAETMRAFYRRFLSVRSLEVPTIAAINGHAIGAGLYCVLITPYTMCLLSIVYHLSTRLQARLLPPQYRTHRSPVFPFFPFVRQFHNVRSFKVFKQSF